MEKIQPMKPKSCDCVLLLNFDVLVQITVVFNVYFQYSEAMFCTIATAKQDHMNPA